VLVSGSVTANDVNLTGTASIALRHRDWHHRHRRAVSAADALTLTGHIGGISEASELRALNAGTLTGSADGSTSLLGAANDGEHVLGNFTAGGFHAG
jgi:hypothetical protein